MATDYICGYFLKSADECFQAMSKTTKDAF